MKFSPLSLRVARRYLQAMDMPQQSNWTIEQLDEWHARTPKPRSIYDRYPKELRPFDWSTPAPIAPGVIPKPSRVAHADRAKVLLKNMLKDVGDLYVLYADSYRGREQLQVGLHGSESVAERDSRMQELANALAARRFRIRRVQRGGRPYLWIVDDIPSDALGS